MGADNLDLEQRDLLKQITGYLQQISEKISFNYGDLDHLFDQLALKRPEFQEDAIVLLRLVDNDSAYYSQDELKRLENYINTDKFKAFLSKQSFSKTVYRANSIGRIISANNLMEQIESYYPDVQLIFTDVGIIGTAIDGFDNVGAKSTKMNKINGNEDIWQITLHLDIGRVKFRCRDSWAQNWGGTGFPKGNGYQDGPDIQIPEAGTYKITLNTETGKYSFVLQEAQK